MWDDQEPGVCMKTTTCPFFPFRISTHGAHQSRCLSKVLPSHLVRGSFQSGQAFYRRLLFSWERNPDGTSNVLFAVIFILFSRLVIAMHLPINIQRSLSWSNNDRRFLLSIVKESFAELSTFSSGDNGTFVHNVSSKSSCGLVKLATLHQLLLKDIH